MIKTCIPAIITIFLLAFTPVEVFPAEKPLPRPDIVSRDYYSGLEPVQGSEAPSNPDGYLGLPAGCVSVCHALWLREDTGITRSSAGMAAGILFPLSWWCSMGLEAFTAGFNGENIGVPEYRFFMSLHTGDINRRGFLSNPDGLIWKPGFSVSAGERRFKDELGLIYDARFTLPVLRDLSLGLTFGGRTLPEAAYSTGIFIKVFSRFSPQDGKDRNISNPDGKTGGFGFHLGGIIILDPDFEKIGEGMEMRLTAPLSTHLSLQLFYTADRYDFSLAGGGVKFYFK